MEWLSELFGFFIVLLVFMLPLLRKFIIDKRKKKQDPRIEMRVKTWDEEEESYDEEDDPFAPVVTDRLVKKDYTFQTDIEDRELDSSVEDRRIGVRVDPQFNKRIVSESFILDKKKKKNRTKNPIVSLTKNKDPLQAMVILYEVLGSPKFDDSR
ncbi:MAG: hypothetical protein S4CHLAM123_11000 [Chlamydiales bacterium]|nr:hypothetical protein [Chlamydiales bacterium]